MMDTEEYASKFITQKIQTFLGENISMPLESPTVYMQY